MAPAPSRWNGFRCMECGYDLSGIDSSACPECGHILIPGGFDLTPARDLARRHRRVALGLCAAGTLLTCIGLIGGIEVAAVLLVFTFTYCFVAGIALLLVSLASAAVAQRHQRSRVSLVWRCSAGWCLTPAAVVPPTAALGICCSYPSAVGFFFAAPLLLAGLAFFIFSWCDAARLLRLPLTTPALLVQLASVLTAAALSALLLVAAIA